MAGSSTKRSTGEPADFEPIDLPADLRDLKCDGREECRLGQDRSTLVKQIRR